MTDGSARRGRADPVSPPGGGRLRWARVAGAVAIAAVLAVAVLAVRYDGAHAAWAVRGAAIGSEAYDATASDAAYREVEDALVWVERAARVAAALIVVAGVAVGRSRPHRERSTAVGARRAAARAIDVATLGVALAGTQLHVTSLAWTAALAWVAPALVIALVLGVAVTGATLGDRLTSRG